MRRRLFLLDVEVEALGERGYLATSPELQGCHAEGDSIARAMRNLEDVARALIAVRIEDGLRLPRELEEGSVPTIHAAVSVSIDRA